jgi:hypothetical protein
MPTSSENEIRFVLAIDSIHHILQKATDQGRLHPISGRAPTIRMSLYVDDAVIFLAPIKDDIEFLATTLANFGEVTGLVTNCAKSHVAPSRCKKWTSKAFFKLSWPC